MSLKTSPPGGPRTGTSQREPRARTEPASPLPGLALRPGLQLAPPGPTPPSLLCSTSHPSSGDECSPRHTASLLSLEFGVRGKAARPGLGRADPSSAALASTSPSPVPAAQHGSDAQALAPRGGRLLPEPAFRGAPRHPAGGPPTRQRPGGRVAEATFPGLQRPHGHVRGKQEGTGGRMPRPSPAPVTLMCSHSEGRGSSPAASHPASPFTLANRRATHSGTYRGHSQGHCKIG